jgi:ribose/xylose/arabinose/galactoside ABC-type transport system permease subunit
VARSLSLYPVFMNDLGRLLVGIGLAIAAIGAAILLLGKTGIPLGRLPGDFSWRGKHTTVYFPLVTCIVVSVVLSLVFWLLSHLRK